MNVHLTVAPTEPPPLKDIADAVNLEPERYGVDLLYRVGTDRLVGVQRKEIKDLVASLADGRLAKELGQMKALDHVAIWLEGDIRFINGMLKETVRYGQKITQDQWRGIGWSLGAQGVEVMNVDSTADLIDQALLYKTWLAKDRHVSLLGRPTVPRNIWGESAGNREWGMWLLQSFPNMGAVGAGKLYDHFGRVPMSWDVGEDELMEVDGIGTKTAQGLLTPLQIGEDHGKEDTTEETVVRRTRRRRRSRDST